MKMSRFNCFLVLLAFQLALAESLFAGPRTVALPHNGEISLVQLEQIFSPQITLSLPIHGKNTKSIGTLTSLSISVDGKAGVILPISRVGFLYLSPEVYQVKLFPIYEYYNLETGEQLFLGVGTQPPLVFERLKVPSIPRNPFKAPTNLYVLTG